MTERLNEVYSAPNGLPLKFDLYHPDSDALAPLVVCIHGGGWISGDKYDMRDVARILSAHGYAAACVQYRLAPLHPFPAAVEDVREFVKYAKAEAADLHVLPGKIASFGISAGAHLALMTALGSSDSRVDAVIDICGITDVTQPRKQHFEISWSFLEQFMGMPFEGHEETYQAASPVFLIEPGIAPCLILHGVDDDVVPISQSEALARRLEEVGTTVEFERFANEGHSFSFSVWPKIEALCIEFLKRYVHP